jgi:uncharacterized protein
MSEQTSSLRFGSSWQTQFRITQAIGRALVEIRPVQVTVVSGLGNLRGLESGDVDLIYTKSVVNEHRYSGKGIHAGAQPDRWLRTIAWLPQEDRILFALAPWIQAESFEELAAKRIPLKMAAQRSVNVVLRQYGFSLEDIESWGGSVGSMHHTAHAARERHQRGELDACFGDGSEYDGSAWEWMAERGYRFLGLRPDVMEALEQQHGLRRNVTPAGFLPGINQTLLALDDSHIVLTCHERLDPDLGYALAQTIEENKQAIECSSIQVGLGDADKLPLPRQTLWSSMTGPIERQWDPKIVCAPLHPGAERFYRERGLIS